MLSVISFGILFCCYYNITIRNQQKIYIFYRGLRRLQLPLVGPCEGWTLDSTQGFYIGSMSLRLTRNIDRGSTTQRFS